jgi:hypothetical protein
MTADQLRAYEDLKNTYGEERAEEYKAGLQASTQATIDGRRDALLAEQEMFRKTKDFMDALEVRAPKELALWHQMGELPRKVKEALSRYAIRVDGGEAPDIDRFMAEMQYDYIRDPRMQAKVGEWRKKQEQRMREQIAAEERAKLAAKEAEGLKEAATRHKENPHSRTVTVETGRRSGLPPAEEEPENLTESQRKRGIRERIRGAYAQQ